ncbi:MAG: hypothetical protein ABSE62_09975 [Chthoniobacteraceae bacterium]|jgi:hypothetical protein
MKKILLGVLLFIVAYVGFYFLARSVANHHRLVSRMLGPVYYPLRLMTASHAAVIHDTGTMMQDTNGNWGVRYITPRENPRNHQTPIIGVGFLVPDSLADTVQSYKGKIVQVDIGAEPDPDYLSNERLVLMSITTAKP